MLNFDLEGDNVPIVLDNGSLLSKSGFAGDDSPRSIFTSVVGRPRHSSLMINTRDTFIGDDAVARRGMFSMKYPIENGIITNWDDIEKIWHYTFYDELRIDPNEHPILLAEDPFNPKSNQEKMTQMMFELFDTPAMYVANQAALSLYASGRTTGCVFDSGDGASRVVPIYDGFALREASTHLEIAGRDMTEYMMRLLIERGYSMTGSSEREILRDMKERRTFIALDYENAQQQSQSSVHDMEYELPDGAIVVLRNERFQCPEVMFQPNLLGRAVPGVHECIYRAIMNCDVDIQPELCSNLVLSGGSSMFPGFGDRLKKEISPLVGNTLNVKVISTAERKYSVWIGGSILASLSSFQDMWMTKEHYEEIGPSIVYKKCF